MPTDVQSLTKLRALLARADHLGSLREAVESFEPERRHALLRRAAIPVVFDEALARAVLLPGLAPADESGTPDPDADIAWLLDHSDIERLGGTEALYRMRDDRRGRRLERWFAPNDRAPAYDDPIGGIALSQAIVRYLAPVGAPVRVGWLVEHLYHLAIADPTAAAERLDAMYREADAEFDVPRCYRVLQTIGGQRALLVRHRDQRDQRADRRQGITRLVELHDGLQQYYEARCTFAGDLAKSAHALERPFMREEWERIWRINVGLPPLEPSEANKWIIDLTAQGGMGKTIFLQWLAARKCVPQRIPYARIDFDFTDPTVLPQAPWLLLVRLAQQLNAQITGRPFTGFIDKYNEYASIARELAGEGRAKQTVAALDTDGDQRLAHQVTEEFAATLRDTLGGAVIIVLDTVEDVIRRRTTNLLAVIGCLAEVHAGYPNLRLILAGRFDLRDDDKLKGFAAAYGDFTRSREIKRFETSESERYLVDVRGLPKGDAVRAMAECSRGLPFALSLYADEWQVGGEMTEAQVRASPDPELKYLVNRVLRRIEASDWALCWLLRYGVVPRRLTKRFLRDVLLPEMHLVLSGASRRDDPRRDSDPLHPFYAASPQANAVGAPSLEVDELWSRLESYASTLSFVRTDADRDTLVFHEDAVRPMRRELQRQLVFRRLQRRAALYYARLAREVEHANAQRWGQYMRAMLFHRFQLGGPDAARAWERALVRASAKNDLRLVFEIATELTQPEYLDDDRRPIIREDGSPIVELALLRDALIAKTRSALQLAASSGGAADADWGAEAERALEDLVLLHRRDPALPANRGTLAVLRAQIDARYGRADEALRRLEHVRPTMTTPAERLELAIALGAVYAAREDPAAIDHLAEAVRLGESDDSFSARQLLELRQVLAMHGAMHDRYDLAIEQLLKVRTGLPSASMERCYVTARLADVYLGSDDIRQALGAARNARRACATALAALTADAPNDRRAGWLAARAEVEVVEARALLAAGDPAGALTSIDSALVTSRALASLQPTGPALELMAAAAEARARSARGATLSFMGRQGAALDELETARQLWAQRVNRVEQSAADLHRKILLLLDRVGDLKMVDQHLSEAERITLPPRGDAWTAFRVAAVRLADARSRADDAAERLRTFCPPDTPRVPRADVRVAVAALAKPREAPEPYADLLARALERITPASARRLCISAALPEVAPLVALGDAGLAIARSIGVTYPSESAAPGGLTTWTRLDSARVAYALGARDDARRWLASVSAGALARASAPAVAFAHLLECEMGLPDEARQARDVTRALIANPGEYATLAGVVACREAWRLARAGKSDEARAMAESAAPLLAAPGEPASIWAARCDELRAELAQTNDDRQHFLAEAISRYDALDQQARAMQLRENRGQVPGEDSASVERPPIVVRLKVDGVDVAGELSLDGEPASTVAFDARRAPSHALDYLRSDLEAATAQAIPYQILRLLAEEWAGAIRDLGALLGPRELWDKQLGAAGATMPPVDVRLEIDAPLLETLPLECFSDRGSSGCLTTDERVGVLYRSVRILEARRTHVMWVQRAVSSISGARVFADGIEGPQTRTAVSEFQASVGIAPTGEADGLTSALLFDRLRRLQRGDQRLRALVLAPAAELARSVGGEDEAAAERIARIYDDAGFETIMREGIAVSELREMCTSFRPEVIHVRAPLRESASLGGIVLDVRAGSWSENAPAGRGDALTPSGVTRALGQTQWPDRPIVVLDPSRMRGRTHSMQQLLLRNGFAAELFRQGTAVAVLGVGLGEPDLHARMTRTIADSLARGHSLSDLVTDLREKPAPGKGTGVSATVEGMLPTVGVALWAFDPSLVYLAPPAVRKA